MGSLLARTFASPCLGCEPNARVTTTTNKRHKKILNIRSVFDDIEIL
jgi:hypothetical protein